MTYKIQECCLYGFKECKSMFTWFHHGDDFTNDRWSYKLRSSLLYGTDTTAITVSQVCVIEKKVDNLLQANKLECYCRVTFQIFNLVLLLQLNTFVWVIFWKKNHGKICIFVQKDTKKTHNLIQDFVSRMVVICPAQVSHIRSVVF